ncbi:MAG: TetR family transcriptional regulator [Myxococcota bacterium]
MHKPADSRERILAAATELFAEFGFDGVALTTVIERSNTSKGTLYHYFSGKEDLYATVLEQMLDRIWAATFDLDAIGSCRKDEFWSLATEGSRRSASYMLERPAETRLWRDFQEQWRVLGDAGPTQRLRQRNLAMGSRLAERGQALGCVRRDLSPEQCAELIEAVDNVLDGWFFTLADEHGEARAFEIQLTRQMDMIRRMLAPASSDDSGGSSHE